MPAYRGTERVTAIWQGETRMARVYHGADLVFSSGAEFFAVASLDELDPVTYLALEGDEAGNVLGLSGDARG